MKMNSKDTAETFSTSADDDDDDEDLTDAALFQEPEGYFPPEKPPTFVEHTLLSGEKLHLRLVGHNPLWVRGFRPISTQQLISWTGSLSMECGPGAF